MAKAIAKAAGGRPTEYSAELAEAICQLIITGLSVCKISERDDMRYEDTIYTWLAKHREFSEKYSEAVEHRTNKYMDECVDLADTMPDGIMFIGLDGRLYPRKRRRRQSSPSSTGALE